MEQRVLVAYASRHGATAGIAERIGQALQEAGVAADVRPCREVEDLTPYSAIVLGSGVYIGQWLQDAATFLVGNEAALAQKPVWLFSDGPTGQGDPVALMKGWRFPEKLQPVADRIKPRGIAFFAGALDSAKMSLPEKLIVKAIKAPLGDYRDWDAITAWGRDIAADLQRRA